MKRRRTAAPIHSRLVDEDDEVITDMFKYLYKTKKKVKNKKVRGRYIIPSPLFGVRYAVPPKLSFDEGVQCY